MTRALIAVIGVSGAALVWRAFAGPILIHSPMNIEGVFGLALVLLLLTRSVSEDHHAPPRRMERADGMVLLAIAALVLIAFGRVAGTYFLSDDFVLLKNAEDYRRNTWQIFTHGGGDGFYRPLIYLTVWLTEAVARQSPLYWHAIAIAMHVVNCWLVYLLASGLGFSRFAAGLASALFALHGTRPETVVWITGRFDLLATFFALATLVLFIRDRRWTALAALFLGLLCKESVYSVPLLLTVIAAGEKAPLRDRLLRLLPFWIVTAALFGYRWWLVGGLGGYVVAGGKLEVASTGLLPVVKSFASRIWAVLFFPLDWSIQPGWWIAVLMIGFIAVLAAFDHIKVSRRALVLSLGLLLAAALPTFHRLLIGPDLEKARYLYLPSIGFCLLIAAGVDRSAAKYRWAPAAILILFNAAVLEHNLSAWKSASANADAACQIGAAALQSHPAGIAVVGLPRVLHGVYFFQNGFPECVSMRAHIDPARVLLLDASPPADGGATILKWNPSTETLGPTDRVIHP